MDQRQDNGAQVLEYSTTPETGDWPVAPFIGTLVWAFVTLRLLTYELPKGPKAVARNNFRLGMQVALLCCAGIRLAWAVRRKEKGKGWAFYVVLLVLAAPLWILAESFSE
jgi:hypothetical protein